MKRTVQDVAIVLAVAAVVFFTNLGGPRLWDRDEPRNAGCAAEMLAADNWITPVFNAELRSHKPVLTYWFMMASYALLGVNEFAARLPSAVFGVGTCLLTWFMGRRLFGPPAGVWAAVVLATTMMFGVASRAATPDAPLIFFSTLSLAIYVYGTTRSISSNADATPGFEKDFPTGWVVPTLMYAAMGCAVLAKGPVGCVLPTAVIGMSLLIRRLPPVTRTFSSNWERVIVELVRPFAPMHFLRTCWSMRPLLALGVILAVALPWYVWVHLRTDGAWTYGFFMKHNLERATRAMDGHNGGLLFYPIALILGFFPWSIFWVPTMIESVRTGRKTEARSGAFIFALCWVGVYVGLFSLAKTKLPSYITPCYPGLALLTGVFLDRWVRSEITFPAVWRRIAFGSLIFAGIGTAIVLPLVCMYLLPGEEFLGIVAAIPLIGGIMALLMAERGQAKLACRWTAGTAIALSTVAFALVADRVDNHRHLEDLVSTIYSDPQNHDAEIASLSSCEGSWVFYCGQPIPALSSPEEVIQFLSEPSPTGKARVVVTTAKRMSRDDSISPLANYVVGRIPYFMRQDEILVLKPTPSANRSAELPSPYEIR